MPRTIFLKGNTQFYKNRLSAGCLADGSGVNRLVYEPELPL
jgi:hypothetical protein